MKRIYKTAKGRTIDVDALLLANERTVAVGNMRTNAVGDVLGKGGKIVKKRNEVAKEYYKHNPNAVKHVSIKDRIIEESDEKEGKGKGKGKPKPKGTKKVTKKDLMDDFIEHDDE